MNAEPKVRWWHEEDGRILRVRLADPPGNVLDGAVLDGLLAALAAGGDRAAALVLDAEGPHFSYGSSIPEHLPGAIETALPAFHEVVRELVAAPAPTLVAVRGRCLGGGLELAACCDLVFAAPGAAFGQPEIRLGVFAPVASLVLRERVGDGRARDLLLSGRSIDAETAERAGLVQVLADDPTAAALTYARDHLLAASPSSLRLAVRAARLPFATAVLPLLDAVERLYLDELMATPDAVEGVTAFLEKRAPRWTGGP